VTGWRMRICFCTYQTRAATGWTTGTSCLLPPARHHDALAPSQQYIPAAGCLSRNACARRLLRRDAVRFGWRGIHSPSPAINSASVK
jgi:hypothetical protein